MPFKNIEQKREYNRIRTAQIKARKKEQERERREAQEQAELARYASGSIKVLLSLKEYTELSPVKKRLWMDFSATLNDIKKLGIGGIVEIQRLVQQGEELVRDYYQTAKTRERNNRDNWTKLSGEEQEKLVKYWAREKVRLESNLHFLIENYEGKASSYERELELAKRHEERGKVGCECWGCAEKKKVRGKIKDEWETESEGEKEECSECGKLRVLEEESGVCKECARELGHI